VSEGDLFTDDILKTPSFGNKRLVGANQSGRVLTIHFIERLQVTLFVLTFFLSKSYGYKLYPFTRVFSYLHTFSIHALIVTGQCRINVLLPSAAGILPRHISIILLLQTRSNTKGGPPR